MTDETVQVQIELTARGFRQGTEHAMGNDILFGLIEAITNADDAYGDDAGPILVRFPKPPDNKNWTVEVHDRAKGMLFSQVQEKLLLQGSRTSGHEKGEAKRGNRGRGAKDLTHFGRVRWDIIRDGKYFWLELDRDGGGPMMKKPVPADSRIRDRLGIQRNGVCVTVTCDRSRFRRPRRDTIREKLELAVQLRGIMSNSKRPVKFQYGDDEPVTLHYSKPAGVKEFPPVEVEVSGYPGKATIVVAELSTPLQEDPGDPCRHGGCLIKSGRAVHEATLYRFESSPYAGYFLGTVRWDTIDDLSRDVDDRGSEVELDSANPSQIISLNRRGLYGQHPATKALKAAVEAVLQPHFERKAAQVGGEGSQSVGTKRRLTGLARVIARYRLKKSDELELESTFKFVDEVELTPEVPDLEIIPPRKVLEFGKEHTFSVRARRDRLIDPSTGPVVRLALVAEPEGCLSLPLSSLQLVPDKRLEGRVSGTFTALAGTMEGSAAIEVRLEGVGARLLEVVIVEPVVIEPPEAPVTFEFDKPTYTVGVLKRKKILVVAPSSAVAKHGTRVVLSNSDPTGLLIRRMTVDLERSLDGDWYDAVVELEGRQHGAKCTVTARCGTGPLRAQTVIAVGRDESGPQPPEIVIGHNQSYARGTWEEDDEGNVKITINAAHPAVRRYFGAAPDFPTQNSVEARLMIAEIAADLTIREILNKQLKTEMLGVEQLYVQRYKWLTELLPQCHQSQLSDAELTAHLSGRPED